jgi:hypothetical protein
MSRRWLSRSTSILMLALVGAAAADAPRGPSMVYGATPFSDCVASNASLYECLERLEPTPDDMDALARVGEELCLSNDEGSGIALYWLATQIAVLRIGSAENIIPCGLPVLYGERPVPTSPPDMLCGRWNILPDSFGNDTEALCRYLQ